MADAPLRADAKDNRARLIAAARRAVTRSGDLRLNAIAKEAGVGQGTLYRHFPNRESLLLEVYRADVDELCALAPALLRDHLPVEALRLWFDRLADYANVKHGVFNVIEAASRSDLIAGSHGPIDEAIEVLLAAGRADGSLRADVDARDVVLLVGYLTRLDDAEREARAGHLLAVVLDGLRAR
ncbi:TetR/AcrR family transcriptional regulator [Aeromicrobium chenweiae]|uniref:TetR family transcriptional regulator n=1 Tax=Aeromicrobium chenweiae TaxID=2079793 RepID=A0A2S0WNZ7_9ACTN|nr:TetR/AcrR family transcriptional regulator [Aeromicrobium chenweiae]AWB93068.1 TetR family transcriptional regulator [Aeromicrobium chenweiae]TGN34056.1 TetR/AcrR family transcriptional regulator [Aeromicrobium chenweiae]